MIQKDSQTETGEMLLAPFDFVTDTSESTRAKTAETFLELLGARVLEDQAREAIRKAHRPNSFSAAAYPVGAIENGQFVVIGLRFSIYADGSE
jgi:hypothetical protein